MNGETISDGIFGLLMSLFGVIGLILAIGARDAEIFIFGASLTVFAIAFIAGLVRRRATVPVLVASQVATHV